MKVLTPADVSAGLPASAAASALLGKSGAAALLVLLFLAVTSASSAEMIAVSSILTYDVYVVRLFLVLWSCHGFSRVDVHRDTSTLKQLRLRSFAWVMLW